MCEYANCLVQCVCRMITEFLVGVTILNAKQFVKSFNFIFYDSLINFS